MKRYTLKRNQIFDNLRGCFVMWKTATGGLAFEDEFRRYMMDCINKNKEDVSSTDAMCLRLGRK